MGKPENRVEEHLRRAVKAAGGMCLKFLSATSGVPDRIVVLAGHTVFVELKAPGGRAEPLQLERIAQLRRAGADARIVSSRPAADALVAELLANPAVRPDAGAEPTRNRAREPTRTLDWKRRFPSSTKE